MKPCFAAVHPLTINIPPTSELRTCLKCYLWQTPGLSQYLQMWPFSGSWHRWFCLFQQTVGDGGLSFWRVHCGRCIESNPSVKRSDLWPLYFGCWQYSLSGWTLRWSGCLRTLLAAGTSLSCHCNLWGWGSREQQRKREGWEAEFTPTVINYER